MPSTRRRASHCGRSRARLALLAVLATSLACATVDFDGPRTESHALDGSKTRLGRIAAPYVAAHPGRSGFQLLEDGIDALSARLLLANRAEQSIDAQYYFLLDDVTTYAFLGQLLEAADRGVRVRLLIDDIHTKGYERGLDAFASHPNFEIRIFNPFSRRQAREIDFLTDFGRANRRMHNKSFTVDGTVTVVGGRNIGAEYFSAREDVNFTDLDVLGAGPVARDVGAGFDRYWNSAHALPVAAVVEAPTGPDAGLPALRAQMKDAIEELARSKYADALRGSIVDQLEEDPESLEWADYRVVYDAPEKAEGGGDGQKDALTEPLAAAIQEAREELFVTSPYFVPLASGVDFFRELRDRGVDVTIFTNSLGSTDVSAVHAGYAPYRRELLELGVSLYEARRDASVKGAKRAGMAFSSASLHAKWFTIDRASLFVGSFNWDPRSVGINTEMGVLIESPKLAKRIVEDTLEEFPLDSYRVLLSESGRLRWKALEDGQTVIYKREPGTTFWKRFAAGFLRLLPIREQL